MWYDDDVLYVMEYARINCFVVRGCALSRRYIDVCKCDVLSSVNVYLNHSKFCVVCINGRRCVCCGECNDVSNECDKPIPSVCSISVRTVAKGCTLGVFFHFSGELGFQNCGDICMCVS